MEITELHDTMRYGKEEKERGNMKQTGKWGALAAAVMLLALSAASAVYAYSDRVKDIPNVRITVSTGDLSAGDELSDDAQSYVSVPDNDYYYIGDAEWLDNTDNLKVGAEPRMKVYLEATPREVSGDNYTTTYLFRSGYTSSNVRVTNGEFISASRRDSGYGLEVTLRVKPIKGNYDAPDDAYWTGTRGTGSWTAGDSDSGYYDVICYRGGSIVKRLSGFKGNSYNFYPYMTKAGDYTFKVRAVAPPGISGSVGKNSDWTDSDSLYISADQVSDGTGQTTSDENGGSAGGSSLPSGNNYPNGTGNENVAGWVKSDGYTYFRYPNGEYVKDGWMKLGDAWYMFDASGRMLTGWQQNKYKIWFYMDPSSGAMKTGWLHDQGYWYFLNTTKDAYEGCLVRNQWWTYNGRRYFFNESGIMVTGWFQIDGKWYYFYPEGSTSGAYGYLATNTTVGTFRVGADGSWQQ